MVHGWMDVAAFSFMVVPCQQTRLADGPIVAIDWRGFWLDSAPGRDSYFFADHLADLVA